MINTVTGLLMMIQVITCPVDDTSSIKECMAEHGYGNYQLFGPYGEGNTYLGYLDQNNQINILIDQPLGDIRYAQ